MLFRSQTLRRFAGSFWYIMIGGMLAASLGADPTVGAAEDEPATEPTTDPYQAARDRMVERHLAERGIRDKRVLEAFRKVPRHRFVPPEAQHLAYEDVSIPIGEAQTITNPYDVALMTEALQPKPTDKVFEVGTGSGFQAAILGQLVADVYSVEIHKPLGERARKVLDELGYDNVHSRVGDGFAGWPSEAPFDAIIVTCARKRSPLPWWSSSRKAVAWSYHSARDTFRSSTSSTRGTASWSGVLKGAPCSCP